MAANYELIIMWKIAIFAYFKVRYQLLLEGTDENHEKPQSG
jgi:hypothetical protein